MTPAEVGLRRGDIRGIDRGMTEEKRRLKVDIPSFNASFNIEGFLDWLAEIEQLFNYMEGPEVRRVKLVACKVKGEVLVLWERLQNQDNVKGVDW